MFDVRDSDKKLPSLFSYLPKALTIIIQVSTVTISLTLGKMNDLAIFSRLIVSEETGKMAASITLETIGHCQGDKQAIMRRGFLWKKQRGGEKKNRRAVSSLWILSSLGH